MPPILTHRVSGVHAEAALPPVAAPGRTDDPVHADSGTDAPAWAQAPRSQTAAKPTSLAQARALMDSPHGRGAWAALASEQSQRPSAQRIAELIDLLPTYPWGEAGDEDGPDRILTDPALWADQLEAIRAHLPKQLQESPLSGDNMTALVFIMMLMAHRETTEGKRDTMHELRMYSGMLDALNKLVARELMPAMREANRLAAQEKDPSRMERIEVKLTFPHDIDTHSAHMDERTGEVTLTMDLGDAPQRKETVQGITALMTLADQWRTSIQNRQTQQSSRFQAQDADATATLNVVNGVLKISHEGASSAIRNLSA